MESYIFIFNVFAYINTVLLIAYSVLSVIFIKKSKDKILKVVAFYLLFNLFFDLLARVSEFFFKINFLSDSIFISLKIIYRLAELLIIGYLINKHWLKSKIVWVLIGASSLYLLYDLFTYRANGLLNYTAYAQIAANVLLVFLIAANLLNSSKIPSRLALPIKCSVWCFLPIFP